MNKYEAKSKFLNEVAFVAMFACKPKPNICIDPFYVRFRKVQKYVRWLYIKIIAENVKGIESLGSPKPDNE